jgi:hypothetical protein
MISSSIHIDRNDRQQVLIWQLRTLKRDFHQDTSNHYLMLACVSAHSPWNHVPNLELRRSYEALRDDQVLPSATMLSNICLTEYALAVDAIKNQLPVGNKVSLALDGWTATNKVAKMSFIAYYMDQN